MFFTSMMIHVEIILPFCFLLFQVLQKHKPRLVRHVDASYVVRIFKREDIVDTDEVSNIRKSNKPIVSLIATVAGKGIPAYRMLLNVLKDVWRYNALYKDMMDMHEKAMVSPCVKSSCHINSKHQLTTISMLNRQLAKLLSGNEVRGKVSIAAMRRRLSLVRYRHGLEKFLDLEHHFIPIRRRFNPQDLPTDLLRVQDPFFGDEGRSFRQETTVHGQQWGRRRWRGMSCSCAVVHRLSKAVSTFF